jgi:type IV secretion system protein TrbL
VLGVGGGLLGAAASIGVVGALLTATDALSDGVVRTAGLGSLAKLGTRIAPAAAISGVAEPALILILGLGYLVASFFVWALFIARKAMIIVAAVFAPVAFCGAASRATSGWVRKWVEFTVAMVFAKLVVVVIFTLALSLVGSPGTGLAAVGSLFSGLAMMVVACFAPWMLLRLVHFIGGDVIAAHHQGATQGVLQAGSTPVNLARSGAAKLGGLVGAGAASGAGGAAAGSMGASGRAGVPVGKALVNNPVIKSIGGAGPAADPAGGGGAGPRGGGPQGGGPQGGGPQGGGPRGGGPRGGGPHGGGPQGGAARPGPPDPPGPHIPPDPPGPQGFPPPGGPRTGPVPRPQPAPLPAGI